MPLAFEQKSPEGRTALRAPYPDPDLPVTPAMTPAVIVPAPVVPTGMTPILVMAVTRDGVYRRTVRQRSGPVDHHGWRAIHRRRANDHGRTKAHGHAKADAHRHARPGGSGESSDQCDSNYDQEVFSFHTPSPTEQPAKASKTQD